MSAIFGSLLSNLLTVVFFAAVAFAGIMGGKKLRDRNDAKKKENK